MKVGVGTSNPVKLQAVKNIFTIFYPNAQFLMVPVESGVSKQPIGDLEIVNGAINRAKRVLEKSDCDFGVGIESGLVKLPLLDDKYGLRQWCAIIDRKGKITLGAGGIFEAPSKIIERVFNFDEEVGEATDKIFGTKESKKKEGLIGFLTKNVMDRTKLTENAVILALVPRINEKLYHISKSALKDP